MVIFRSLGIQNYDSIYQKMLAFTNTRKNKACADEVWLLEHHPVVTIGSSGNITDVLIQNNIPVVYTDRGGQVTYHGPGQLIGYFLLDLRNHQIKVTRLIQLIEKSLCDILQEYNIKGKTNTTHPGIYVDERKICSYGFKVVNGYTYHGFSLNVCMDLKPFSNINPCGLKNISMVNMSEYSNDITLDDVLGTCKKVLAKQFAQPTWVS